jgi:translation initiation factor 1A
MPPRENQKSEFGDFEEMKEEPKPGEKPQSPDEPETIARVRNPRDKEVIGIIVQRLGGNRMEILATDGKTRNCRVPGRYRRRLWLRPKDIVLIVPWEFDDGKADIIYKYPKPAIIQLRKRGILDSLKSDF